MLVELADEPGLHRSGRRAASARRARCRAAGDAGRRVRARRVVAAADRDADALRARREELLAEFDAIDGPDALWLFQRRLVDEIIAVSQSPLRIGDHPSATICGCCGCSETRWLGVFCTPTRSASSRRTRRLRRPCTISSDYRQLSRSPRRRVSAATLHWSPISRSAFAFPTRRSSECPDESQVQGLDDGSSGTT